MSESKIDQLNEMLKNDPDNKEILTELGMGYLNQGNYEQAEKTWEKAGNLGSAEALYNLGVLYGMVYLQDISEDELWELHSDEEVWFEKAEIAYQSSLDIDPKNIHALKNLATLYMERGQKEDALTLLRKILEYSVDDDYRKKVEEEIKDIENLT
jgi:Flp pilus assembly protein TadD